MKNKESQNINFEIFYKLIFLNIYIHICSWSLPTRDKRGLSILALTLKKLPVFKRLTMSAPFKYAISIQKLISSVQFHSSTDSHQNVQYTIWKAEFS